MITHNSVFVFINAVMKEFNHTNKDITICRTPPCFDPFLSEIVPYILSGGKVFIQDRNVNLKNLLKFIEENKITNFGCGPSLLFLLVDNKNLVEKFNLSSLREIYIGYEKLTVSLLTELQNMFPKILFINGYGTTETFAASLFYKVPKLNNCTLKEIPIGKSIGDYEVLIINNNKIASKSEIGKIYIRGNNLFNGYWKRNDLSKKVLVINPLFEESQEYIYDTGDYGYYDDNFNIIFVGRKDEQIKLNGHRVEIGEVKTIIEECCLIKECVILFKDNMLNCIYTTFDKSYDQYLQLEKIKEYCIQKLPGYKIPKKWILKDEIPRNSNHKVDKNSLEKEL